MRTYENRAESLNRRINYKGNNYPGKAAPHGSFVDKVILSAPLYREAVLNDHGNQLDDRYNRLNTRKQTRMRDIKIKQNKKEAK